MYCIHFCTICFSTITACLKRMYIIVCHYVLKERKINKNVTSVLWALTWKERITEHSIYMHLLGLSQISKRQLATSNLKVIFLDHVFSRALYQTSEGQSTLFLAYFWSLSISCELISWHNPLGIHLSQNTSKIKNLISFKLKLLLTTKCL